MQTEKFQITLEAARVNAGLTQEEAAKKMSVSKKTLIAWEKGRSNPSSAAMIALSAIYGAPLDRIFLP